MTDSGVKAIVEEPEKERAPHAAMEFAGDLPLKEESMLLSLLKATVAALALVAQLGASDPGKPDKDYPVGPESEPIGTQYVGPLAENIG